MSNKYFVPLYEGLGQFSFGTLELMIMLVSSVQQKLTLCESWIKFTLTGVVMYKNVIFVVI